MATKAERYEGIGVARALLEANGFVHKAGRSGETPKHQGRPQLALPGTDVRAVIGRQTTTIYRVEAGPDGTVDVVANRDTLDLTGILSILADIGAVHADDAPRS